MPILHMETEQVRAANEFLQLSCQELQHQKQDMINSVYHLIQNWEGSNRDYFWSEAETVLTQIGRLAESGLLLHDRVNHEIEEWETAANNLGAGLINTSVETSDWLNSFLENFKEGINPTDAINWIGDHIDEIELFTGLGSLGFVSILPGMNYAGQVILKGPQWAKELIGISPYLTHVKGTGMTSHIASQPFLTPLKAITTLLQIAPQWIEDYNQYYDTDKAQFASAILVDTVFIGGVSLLASYGGSIVGAKIGGGVGALVGGPVGAATGAIIGGVVGQYAASWLADELIIQPFLESDIRQKVIESGAEVIRDAQDVVTETLDEAVDAIRNVSLPEIKFSW